MTEKTESLNEREMTPAILALADGTVFRGRSYGAVGSAVGEVVFNTSMTGYQEILTDPSYKGQLVTMTYTQIGNTGVNPEDGESLGGPKVEGFIVKEGFSTYSNWRAEGSLETYLRDHGVVGIQGIDTRMLTRILRDRGSQMGVIVSGVFSEAEVLERVRAHPGIGGLDLVSQVAGPRSFAWTERVWRWPDGQANRGERGRFKVAAYDFGVKLNILRLLVDAGCDVTVVPPSTPAEEVLGLNPDGIFLSNGPGNPETQEAAVENVRQLLGKKPLFGICLGHQILGLALGGRAYKLKFGHHGGNHPVKDLDSGRIDITSQNHNYCIALDSLGSAVRLTHRNLYDGTEEGMAHREFPAFSVQFHPEAGPGPNDARYLFTRFTDLMEAHR